MRTSRRLINKWWRVLSCVYSRGRAPGNRHLADSKGMGASVVSPIQARSPSVAPPSVPQAEVTGVNGSIDADLPGSDYLPCRPANEERYNHIKGRSGMTPNCDHGMPLQGPF
jgi:hypothetical protein